MITFKMKAIGTLLAMMFLGAIALWLAEGGNPGGDDDRCDHRVTAEVEHEGGPVTVEWSLGDDVGDTESRDEFSRTRPVRCGTAVTVSGTGIGSVRCSLLLDGQSWGSSGWQERRCSVTRAIP